MSFLHEHGFFYLPDFLTAEANDDVERQLQELQVTSPAERWAASSLVLAPPVSDDIVVQGRLEGAAGWPIWVGGAPVVGPPIPDFLEVLLARAAQRLDEEGYWAAIGAPAATLTSVYVDRYPTGGHFVPHTDRDCYGRVVVGASIGAGSCRLHFTAPDQEPLSFTLGPGSLYAFTSPLRDAPWVHSVDGVDGVRFAISMRTAAPALADPRVAR